MKKKNLFRGLAVVICLIAAFNLTKTFEGSNSLNGFNMETLFRSALAQDWTYEDEYEELEIDEYWTVCYTWWDEETQRYYNLYDTQCIMIQDGSGDCEPWSDCW
jgi:hypothetical protein